MATATAHHRAARRERTEAARLRTIGRSLHLEHDHLTLILAPIGMRMGPHVWDGPAARRASEGLRESAQTLANARSELRDRMASLAARARQHDNNAAWHDREAARIRAATLLSAS